MKVIAENTIFLLIGAVIPFSISMWQWWAWAVIMGFSVFLHDYVGGIKNESTSN